MALQRHLQLLRNSKPYADYEAAKAGVLSAVVNQDGVPVLARYYYGEAKNGQARPVRTLLGLVYRKDNANQVTILDAENNIDENTVDGLIEQYVNDNLNSDDTPVAGRFVTAVSMESGGTRVERAAVSADQVSFSESGYTAATVGAAIKELQGKAQDGLDELASATTIQIETLDADSVVTLENPSSLRYVIYQGDPADPANKIGEINIPKDTVVSEGEIITADGTELNGTSTASTSANLTAGEKYVKLTLANADETRNLVYVAVSDLVDVYTGSSGGVVNVSVNGYTISASVNDGSITGGKIARNTISGSNIADGAVGAAQIADGVIPDVSGLATKTEVSTGLAGKVDKVNGYGLSEADYTTAEKTKLAGLPTGSDLNTTLGSKANAADVYTKAQTDAAIQEAVEDIEAGETVVIDADGANIVDEHDNNSVLLAPSARQMKLMYENIMAIYDGLANIAFTNGKPTLNWIGSKTKYTLSYGTLTGCTADVAAGQVDEGGLRIKLTPTQSSYAFTSVLVNGDSVTPVATGDADGSVYVDIIVNQDITLAATAISGYGVSLASGSNCSLSPASVTPNSTYNGVLSPNQHYTLPSSISATMGGSPITFDGTTNSYNSTTGAIKISNVTGTVVITASATPMQSITVTLDGTNVVFKHSTDTLTGSVTLYEDDKPYVINVKPQSGYSMTAPTATGCTIESDGDDGYNVTIPTTVTSALTITASASMPTTLTLNTKWFQDPATTPTIEAGVPFSLELTPLAGFVAAATQDAGTENTKDIRAAVQVLMNNVDITNDSGVVTFDVTNNKVAINIANPNGLVVINATARLRIKRGYGLMANNSDATDSNTCYTYDKIPFPAECKPVKTFYYGYGSSASMSYSALFYTNGTKSDDCGIRSGDYREYNPPSTCTHFRASVNLTKAQNAQETFPIIKAKVDGGNYVDIITHDDFVNALYANSF